MNTKQAEPLYINKQMIEDLYIIADIYNTSVKEVIKTLIDNEENCHIEIIS